MQPCPGGATGLARWRCVRHADDLEEPRWFPPTPDLSECRSVWLTSLESRVIEGDSLISITSDLSQVKNIYLLFFARLAVHSMFQINIYFYSSHNFFLIIHFI